MEVHAHSSTPHKKWTHYLWEFIMLFLAVFCGFLAENIREHIVEHRQEKQYMQSLISDLSADTGLYFDFYTTIVQLGVRQFEKLFNAADLLLFYIANTSEGVVANIPDTIVIRINTTELNEQLNFMMQEKSYARQETARFKELRGRAERLIELIKKKYHLE